MGVEHLLRDVRNIAVGTLSIRVTDQLHSLKGLHEHLGEIHRYLDNVISGRLPANFMTL